MFEGGPGFLGQGPADDQVQPAAGPEFVPEGGRFELEFRQKPAAARFDRPVLRGRGRSCRRFSFSSTSTFWIGRPPESSVVLKKIGAIRPAENDAAAALVGHEGNVLADMPHDGIAGGFPGRARADDVADEDDPACFRPGTGRSSRCRRETASRPSPGRGAGMSGRVAACLAGEKSSVLISPSTL